MAKIIELGGVRFGRLVALSRERSGGETKWRCVCDCGREKSVRSKDLRNGATRSCGCIKREETIARCTTHGKSKTAEFRIWVGIKKRCTNPNATNFAHYGGRGIGLCDEWAASFDAFLSHVGRRPTHHHCIERIENDRGYVPGNVRWALHAEQMQNTRRSRRVTYRGEPMTVSAAARAAGGIVRAQTAVRRINAGWGIAAAVETAAAPRRGGIRKNAARDAPITAAG